jgi:hypothetical protein
MKRYPDAITLQTNACALISRLSGCSSCQQPSSTDLVAAVQDAGAVQALAQAITSLQAHSSVPASMVCAAEALTALRMLGGQPAASLDIVNTGGVDLITTARDLAQGQGSSPVHAMMLLGQLAYIPESTFEEALCAANAAIDTAQAISNVEQAAQNQQYSSGVRMMWCITSLVEDLSKRPDVDTAALSSCAERNAAIAVAYLSRPDMVSFFSFFLFFKTKLHDILIHFSSSIIPYRIKMLLSSGYVYYILLYAASLVKTPLVTPPPSQALLLLS